MKMTVSVEDDTYAAWKERAAKENVSLSEFVGRRVRLLQDVNLRTERLVVLGQSERQSLEDILGSTVDSPEAVVDLCQRLSRLDMEEVSVPFTVDELERMQMQAEFMGESMQEYMERHVGDFRLYIVGVR